MNKTLLTKNWVFTALWLVIVALILIRITPPSVDHVVKLVISKNRTNIKNINQPRNIETTNTVWVDRLNLLVKSRFSHPKLGNIAGYSDDFFVDIDHQINILKSDEYRFMVGSDDGFSLSIDGKKICEYLADRPFSVQSCLIRLTEGKHQFHLSYYQGYGNSGLTVEYARAHQKKHWFGDNSDSIHF